MSQIMAHRGARNLWAENSCLGFRKTARHGFDAIEFDLHLTDAGEIVVIHDPTLDRTTNGTGQTRDLTPDSRRALRLRGPDGALGPGRGAKPRGEMVVVLYQPPEPGWPWLVLSVGAAAAPLFLCIRNGWVIDEAAYVAMWLCAGVVLLSVVLAVLVRISHRRRGPE